MIDEREPDQNEEQPQGADDDGPDVEELDEDPAYNAEGPAGDLKGG